MWKDRLRPFVRALPQWSPVAIPSPQQVVAASLRSDDGKSRDVTAAHAVASLKPLTIATGFDAGQRAVLEYRDNATGILLGVLRLVRTDSVVAEETPIAFYRIAAGKHQCLGWPRRSWNAWLQNHAMRRSSHHSLMDFDAVQQLMIAYLCPRPVVLVSVAAPGHSNIFPMDLIGPLEQGGLFSLALRSTNVSVPVMRTVRQVALSGMPATMKAVVYKLAEHHRQPLQDWAALPFPVRPSQAFGIPAVAAALRVRELTIVESREIGSHVFFLCRVVSEQDLAEGPQLHHTAGFHQAFRRRHGMPLAEV